MPDLYLYVCSEVWEGKISIMEANVGTRVQLLSRQFSLRLAQWIDALNPPEWVTVMGTALAVGVGTGLGAVIFHWLIEVAQWIFFGLGAQVFAFMGNYYVLVIPAIGGLIGGPLIFFFAREAKGHGVPEVMEAIALHGGRIRPRVAVIKALASSACIGSGGSVGAEGPIVQIGSALGSTVGQFFRLSEERTRSLVACGAAGGIAAVFNAPIAGTIFALEIILGEFHSTYFGAVVISAVIADVVVHLFGGVSPALVVPSYQLVNPGELILYAILGVVSAPVAVLYSKTVDRMEDIFDAWRQMPDFLKTAVGGLAVGVVGVLLVAASGGAGPDANLTYELENAGRSVPAVFGTGYSVINLVLLGNIALGSAVALMFLKLLVTGLTLGSGNSGGVFAPGLFTGAMLGVAFGQVVNTLFPGETGPAGAYALVGMAAVFAGAAHAPATAILILFEMTGDYNIILPLMFATVISLIISRALEPESIYTMKLARRGIRLAHGRDVDLLEGVTVEEAMNEDFDAVNADMPLQDLVVEFERTHHHGFPVVDDEGRLIGMVTLTDVDEAVRSNNVRGRKVRDIATTDGVLVAYPDETLATAMLRMGVRGIGRLPVVSRDDPHKLLGMLRRESLIRAYNHAVARRTNISHRLKALEQHGSENVAVIEVRIEGDMECVGKELREVARKLPEDSIVASIQRGSRLLIPHGDTVLREGDHLTVLARRDQVSAAREAFC